MSAYALLAHAWGAEVAGWDRVETPYLAHLEGIDVTIAPEPPLPPAGWEVYVSTAYAGRVEGRPRADLLAELVSLRAIDRRRRRARQDDDERDDRVLPRPPRARPGLPDRRRDPAARRQRARRQRAARRRGRRVGPLGRRASPGDRGAPERRPRPSRDVRHARRGGGALRDLARRRCRTSSARRSSSRSQLELAVAGEHNRRNAAAAIAALELAGVPRSRRRARHRRVRPARRGGSSAKATPAASTSSTATRTIRPSSPPISRQCGTAAACSRSSSRTCTRGRSISRTSSPSRSRRRTRYASPRSIPRARSRSPGVTGRLIVDELARSGPGCASAGRRRSTTPRAWSRRGPAPGDTVLTLGAGDVDRAAPLLLELLA